MAKRAKPNSNPTNSPFPWKRVHYEFPGRGWQAEWELTSPVGTWYVRTRVHRPGWVFWEHGVGPACAVNSEEEAFQSVEAVAAERMDPTELLAWLARKNPKKEFISVIFGDPACGGEYMRLFQEGGLWHLTTNEMPSEMEALVGAQGKVLIDWGRCADPRRLIRDAQPKIGLELSFIDLDRQLHKDGFR